MWKYSFQLPDDSEQISLTYHQEEFLEDDYVAVFPAENHPTVKCVSSVGKDLAIAELKPDEARRLAAALLKAAEIIEKRVG